MGGGMSFDDRGPSAPPPPHVPEPSPLPFESPASNSSPPSHRSRLHTFWYGDGTRTPWLRRVLAVLFAFFVPIPIVLILLFRFVPVPFTPEMMIPLVKGEGV